MKTGSSARARRAQQSSDPGLTMAEQLPVLALVGLLLVESLALLYPSAAYPLHGVGVSLFLLILLLIAGVGSMYEGGGSLLAARSRLAAGASLLAFLWGILWLLRLPTSEHLAAGRADTITAYLSGTAFLIAFLAMSSWRARDLEEELPHAAARHVSPFFLFSSWVALGLAAMALYGLYQTFGPAWLPKTFRALEQDILQYMPEGEPLREGLFHAARERRATGTVGAPNIFASLLVLGVPMALGCLVASKRIAGRMLFGMAALAMIAAVFASESRGGVLAIGAGGVVFFVLLAGWRIQGRKRLILFVGAGSTFTLLLIAILVALFSIQARGSRWLGETGVTQRVYYWATATEVWKENLLLGEGPGSFEQLYPRYRQPGANETKHPHSWLFFFGSSTGLAGVILFTGLVAFTGSLLEQLQRRLTEKRYFRHFALLAGAGGALAAILFHGLIEYTFAFREASLLFFATLGVVAGFADHHFWGKCSGDGETNWRRVSIPVGAAIVLLIATVMYQIPPARAKMLREEAAFLLEEQNDPEIAIEAWTEAIETDPIKASNWEGRAMLRSRLGDPGARNDYEEAIRRDPHSARLQEALALWYAATGDLNAAIKFQQQAIVRHPLDATHRMTLVELYLENGNEDAAREALQQTVPLRRNSKQEDERFFSLVNQLGIDVEE